MMQAASLSVGLAGCPSVAVYLGAPALSHFITKYLGHAAWDATSERWLYQQSGSSASAAPAPSSDKRSNSTTEQPQMPFGRVGSMQVTLWERLTISHPSPSSQAAAWQPDSHNLELPQSSSSAYPAMFSSLPVLAQPRLALPLWKDVVEEAALYAGKAKNRVKGIGKKLFLRQVNKRIVARLARRATIGIPCLGLLLVSQVLVRDGRRVASELRLGNPLAASAFAAAVLFEASDLLAQAVIVSGMMGANFHVAGCAWLAAYLAAADKFSLASAGLTCTAALLGELLALHDNDRLAAAGEHGGRKGGAAAGLTVTAATRPLEGVAAAQADHDGASH